MPYTQKWRKAILAQIMQETKISNIADNAQQIIFFFWSKTLLQEETVF